MRYEKELGDRLRDDIAKQDAGKRHLLSRLGEQETVSKEITSESTVLTHNLRQKVE
jgi:hypothetical protein